MAKFLKLFLITLCCSFAVQASAVTTDPVFEITYPEDGHKCISNDVNITTLNDECLAALGESSNAGQERTISLTLTYCDGKLQYLNVKPDGMKCGLDPIPFIRPNPPSAQSCYDKINNACGINMKNAPKPKEDEEILGAM